MTESHSGPAVLAGKPDEPLLLYDGVCGLCNGAVQFILHRDVGGAMRFAPLQGATAKTVRDRHPELAGVDSLILVEQGMQHETISVRSEAVLRIAQYLGGVWRWTVVARVIPRPIRDWGYSLIARVRYRVFGRYDACQIPSPEVSGRFLP